MPPRQPVQANPPPPAELYGLPLTEFTRARDALATRLRQSGEADAAETIKRLSKPTPPVWAINQVARRDPGAVLVFLDAVERLRAVQERRISGSLEAATADERGAFGRLLDQVRGQLEAAGFRASPEMLARVTATLRGAAADPARQDELRSGLLKAELRAPGFEAFAGGAPPAELVGRPEKPALRPPAKETVADRRERERVERAEGALRVAESEVSDWHRRAEELDGILAERRTAAQHAKRAVDDLRTRLREAEQRLSQTEHAAEQAEREAVRARHEADRATARRRAAEQAVRRARE